MTSQVVRAIHNQGRICVIGLLAISAIPNGMMLNAGNGFLQSGWRNKMRLIDAETLLREFERSMDELVKSTCNENISIEALSLLCGTQLILKAPTVDAVPLDPLCQWLAGYAAPPNYALDEVRDDSIDPESLVYTANDMAKAWKYHFLELLKSGLMDTEGEDAEEET
jgi:hypothetical protein